mmetsp:Transcript_158587/g.280061  ORF Transcript_158587/g.280061 Transcript_158587/m.280061 type:complete len:182 (-) Transcript_158587:257-802(-)
MLRQLLRPAGTSPALIRQFCSALPPGLYQSPKVEFPLISATNQMAPSKARRGEKSVGVGDRGVGLVYRDGRPASAEAIAQREGQDPPQGTFIIKIQPPLDVSGDSQGGAGRITPATLLLSDKSWKFVRFVKEEDEGHFPLLRCALSEDIQVAYRYAEVFGKKDLKLKVFTSVRPPAQECRW